MNYQTLGTNPRRTRRQSKPLTFDEAIQAPLRKGQEGAEKVFEAASATLVLAADGGPIRTIITGRRVIVTGFYTSRKAGRALPYEGTNEPMMLKRCEVDTRVVDCHRAAHLRALRLRFKKRPCQINTANRSSKASLFRPVIGGNISSEDILRCSSSRRSRRSSSTCPLSTDRSPGEDHRPSRSPSGFCKAVADHSIEVPGQRRSDDRGVSIHL